MGETALLDGRVIFKFVGQMFAFPNKKKMELNANGYLGTILESVVRRLSNVGTRHYWSAFLELIFLVGTTK